MSNKATTTTIYSEVVQGKLLHLGCIMIKVNLKLDSPILQILALAKKLNNKQPNWRLQIASMIKRGQSLTRISQSLLVKIMGRANLYPPKARAAPETPPSTTHFLWSKISKSNPTFCHQIRQTCYRQRLRYLRLISRDSRSGAITQSRTPRLPPRKSQQFS